MNHLALGRSHTMPRVPRAVTCGGLLQRWWQGACVIGCHHPAPYQVVAYTLTGCCRTAATLSVKKSKNKTPTGRPYPRCMPLNIFCVGGFMKNRELVEICPRIVLGQPPGVDHLRQEQGKNMAAL